MIVQAEREKAEVQRKEPPEEDDRGRQKYMSFLDELEAKYGNQSNTKEDWYDTEDAFIDDGDLKDNEAKMETKIGGFFVCRGAPEVVPPEERPPEVSKPKPKKTGDDSSLLDLPLNARAGLKTLKSLSQDFKPGQLERFLQSDVPVTNTKYRKVVTTMFNILNEPSMNLKKMRAVISQFQAILPFNASVKWVNNYFKELAMEYDSEEAGSEAFEARQDYLLTLLKRERMTLTRRVKRTIKNDVKEFQSKKTSEQYKCTTFENIVEDLVNAVNVINAEARVSRDSKKMKSITNKDAKQNFFEKMVENWPSGFMTLDNFTELYNKYRKPIPNPWLKRRRGSSGPNSPKSKNSPNKPPSTNSNKRVINLVTGASNPQPVKKARVEPGGSVSSGVRRPVMATSFCPKWEPNPWAEHKFAEPVSIS